MSVVLHTLDQLVAAINSRDEHFVHVHFGPYAPVLSVTKADALRVIASLPANTVTRDTLGLGRLYDSFVVIGHG